MVENPVGKASTVRSEAGAGKLYHQLQADALHPGASDDERADAYDAMQLLEDEWGPGITRAPEPSGGRSRPGQGSTSRTRKRAAVEPRKTPKRAAAPTPGKQPAASSSARRKQARQRANSTAGRVARTAARETGISGAASTASSVALSTLGLMVGMSLLYLILRKPRAFEQITGGAANAVRALVAPVDPLAPKATPTKSGQAAIDAGLLGPGSPLATASVSVNGPYYRIPHIKTPKPASRAPIGG